MSELQNDLELRVEDLDGVYKEIYTAVVGVLGVSESAAALEIVSEIADLYSGQAIYVPKKEKLFRPARDRRMKSECNGGNVRQLAMKYDLSESHTREIVYSK